MYQHILIATDGSEIARKAVDQGIGLAKRLSARVTAVVVSETITGNILAGQPDIGIMTRTQEIEQAADAAAAKILASVAGEAKPPPSTASAFTCATWFPRREFSIPPRRGSATSS